jgi:hypothetical protein
VAFSVTFDPLTTEAISVNGGVGDDEFVVSPGLASLLVAADGGSGNDTLSGSDENDSLFGGSGADAITGGGGYDLLDGEEGDDRLFARDRTGDLVRGGTGTDSAQTDSAYVDPTTGIEALDATPVDTKAAPKVGKAKVVRIRGKWFARVPVSCPAAASSGCKATLVLETAKRVKLGTVRARLVLGSKGVKLRSGQKATVSIRLTRAEAALAKRTKIATRVR